MRGSNSSSWPVARFPSAGLRQEFLEHVRLWNRVEGLPTIETELMPDGIQLRLWSADRRQQNIWRLVDSFGGRETGKALI